MNVSANNSVLSRKQSVLLVWVAYERQPFTYATDVRLNVSLGIVVVHLIVCVEWHEFEYYVVNADWLKHFPHWYGNWMMQTKLSVTCKLDKSPFNMNFTMFLIFFSLMYSMRCVIWLISRHFKSVYIQQIRAHGLYRLNMHEKLNGWWNIVRYSAEERFN